MRKSCKRKVVIPRSPLDVIQRVDDDGLLKLGLHHFEPLSIIQRGEGNSDHYHALVQSILTSEELAKNGIIKSCLVDIEIALHSLESMQNRYVRVGKYGFSGDEYRNLSRAIANYDQQIQIATKKELLDSLLNVHKLVEDVCE